MASHHQGAVVPRHATFTRHPTFARSPAKIAAFTLTSLTLLSILPAAQAVLIDQSLIAIADIAPTKDSKASGSATFSSAGKDGTRIEIIMKGLTPSSSHGWHVHEKGDCSAPDASSAGGHFALPNQTHGSLEGEGHHAGDLGNLETDANGNARLSLLVPDAKLTVATGPLSAVGKALVVHAKADDLKSQPSGDSGDRIACGVINRKTIADGVKPLK